VIETERLILRQWQEADRAPWRALNADAQVMRYFPAVLSDAEADRLMDRCRDVIAEGGLAFWAVERRVDGAFLGFVGLNCIGHDIPLKGQWETGWRLARHAWGQGYASEAARASLAHGFGAMGLDRIVAYTAASNEPSMAVMRRTGMVPVPGEDFDHPALPDGHPLKLHVVWEVRR
jgi:RimJ/RimL family protein N-acetyltransferase